MNLPLSCSLDISSLRHSTGVPKTTPATHWPIRLSHQKVAGRSQPLQNTMPRPSVAAAAGDSLDSVSWVSATVDDPEQTPGIFGPVAEGHDEHQGVRNQACLLDSTELMHADSLLWGLVSVFFSLWTSTFRHKGILAADPTEYLCSSHWQQPL